MLKFSAYQTEYTKELKTGAVDEGFTNAVIVLRR